ncbi:MAG: AAA family ATPase [Clostridia bacterium]
MARILAFTNQKGGVGKTTTCVNVAACISAMGKQTLLIDLDPQGNATSGLGGEKKSGMKTMYNVIDGDCMAKEAIQPTLINNLDLIPATVDLAGAEIHLVEIKNRENVIKNALNTLKNDYDFIFIDCPPSLGLLTINALTASDAVIIPIQCEFYALEGLSQLMNTIRLIKQTGLNAKLDVDGVVLTMKDNRSNLVAQVSDEISKFFGKKVFETFIPRNIRLAEAPSHGEPILVYDFASKGSQAYISLSEELLKRNNLEFEKINKNTKVLRRNKV